MNPKVFWSLIAILAALQGWFWIAIVPALNACALV